jgi:hypothetical protein
VPSRTASYLEAALALCMIVTVLLFSMEVREDAPLMRFYASLGAWASAGSPSWSGCSWSTT